jgi:hypothetical protein
VVVHVSPDGIRTAGQDRPKLLVVVLAAAALVTVATLRWARPGEVRAVRVTLAGILWVMFTGPSRAGACVVSPTG